MIQIFKKFAKDLLTEDGDKWSLEKVSGAACVIACLIWVSKVVATTHTLPDLESPGIFIGISAGSHGVVGYFKQKLGMNGNGNGNGNGHADPPAGTDGAKG